MLFPCEAAGFDTVIVETVGVGQSETTVAGMTDLFVLLQLPNAGDDLQAIKRGAMELADVVLINKADLDEAAPTRAQAQITSALRLFAPQAHAAAPVLRVSALAGTGVAEFWRAASDFRARRSADGRLAERRTARTSPGCGTASRPGCGSASASTRRCASRLPQAGAVVRAARVAPSVAARRLLDLMH